MSIDLDFVFWNNSLWRWGGFVVASMLTGVAVWLIKKYIVHRVRKLVEKTETQWDDLALILLDKSRFYTTLAIGIYSGSHLLHLTPQVTNGVKSGLMIIMGLQTIVWGSHLIDFFLGLQSKGSGDQVTAQKSAFGIIGVVGRIVLWSAVVLIVLSNLGVNITAIVTGLGVGGVAVALATQKILGDFFSSFIIVFDKPFEVGDFIVAGNIKGTIEQVGIKTTRLKSLTGEQIVIPNSQLIDSELRNFKRMETRRIDFRFTLDHATSSEKLALVNPIVEGVLNEIEGLAIGYVYFKECTTVGLVYEVVYTVDTGDFNVYANLHNRINMMLLERFTKEGIQYAKLPLMLPA